MARRKRRGKHVRIQFLMFWSGDRGAHTFEGHKGNGCFLEVQRSQGHHILDDGFGGDRSYQSALESSNFVKYSIQRFGFLLADEKCKWLPMVGLFHLYE